MKPTLIVDARPESIRDAASLLRAGGLVVFPTDTVYGVGTNPFDGRAIARLFEAKGRGVEKAIPLLLSDPSLVGHVARSISPGTRRLVDKLWPGGLTIVVPKAERVPDILTGGAPGVALRMPNHEVALCLIAEAGGIVAATSANLSGGPSPVTALEAAEQLSGRVDLILDGGPCPGGVASTVVDLSVDPPRLLRRGAVPARAVEAVLGQSLQSP